MKFNPLNGLPDWLKEDYDTSHTSEKNAKHYSRARKYYRQMYIATPPWYTEKHHKQILDIYKQCKDKRKFGNNVVVDHIIPICSEDVCGLNVPWNYQIISERENSQKGNKYWPDMPYEQIWLELPKLHPQLELF